jgi:hypothetical protein
MDQALYEELRDLRIQVLAIRDVVARLLAYEADRAADPLALLRNFEEGTMRRMEKISSDSQGAMNVAEKLQTEVDRIIIMARSALGGDEE